ncbi:DNA topoisomerase IB [Candidatus Microgenomates bacterium]|nr:DNA topoisomerase IB [Candidatus Microgenomates bacterium]
MRIVTRLEGLERIYFDNEYCAELAGLKYLSDTVPGWKRLKKGEKFVYVERGEDVLIDEEHADYCQSLAIPPAWKEVWINKDKSGHLRVTGIDDRGRKQYMYHPKWKQTRELVNFYRVLLLSVSLPRVRSRVAAHLSAPAFSKKKTVALILHIMMKRPIRIGNELYAETNNTYGLSTFEKRHVKVRGMRVTFDFVGKSNKKHSRDIQDKVTAGFINELTGIAGTRLFQYIAKDGTARPVHPEDVNEYLRRVTGYRISAKDFRTWMGTLEAFHMLQKQELPASNKETREDIKEAVETVADTLGNTPAMAKKAYIHPRLLNSYEDKSFFEIEPRTRAKARGIDLRLKQKEKELLSFLNFFLEEDLRSIREGSLS